MAGVAGAVHAGWRGAVAGVIEATVAAMVGLGASPTAIVAVIGPCIGQDSYEVGADLRDAVLAREPDHVRFFVAGRREARWQFDLAGYCAARLAAAGIRSVSVLGVDTAADEAMFFSHRRRTLAGGGPIGHQISIIALDPTVAVLSRLSLLLLLLLASCGDLPEPFIGNPGATGRLLAQPPTPRLAVPPPTDALLPDAASRQFADSLAAGLQAQEVPAVADRVRSNDWQLVATAEQRGGNVVPLFRVLNPKGEDKGHTEGSPVPTQVWAAATRGHARSDRARGRAEDLQPAHRHSARRPEQPVQPHRQGAGRPGDRRARRRQRVADQTDEGASRGAWPGGAGRPPTAPTSSCRATCAWCRSPATSSGWRSSGR